MATNAQAGLAFAVLQRGDRGLAASLARSAAHEAANCGSPSVQALTAYTLGEVLASDGPDEALRRYRDALELWRGSGAEGLLLTVLRNLIVLLVRSGADAAALEIHSITERLATKPSYGDEAERLEAAVAVARDRLGPGAQAVAADATAHVHDPSAAADVALGVLTRRADDTTLTP